MAIGVAIETAAFVEMGPEFIVQPVPVSPHLGVLPEPLASALEQVAAELGTLALPLEAVVLTGKPGRRCEDERSQGERQDQSGLHRPSCDA